MIFVWLPSINRLIRQSPLIGLIKPFSIIWLIIPPAVIQSKAYHIHYEQVKTEIQSLEIKELEALIHVEGGINVDLQCQTGEEQSETFPFEGEISVNLAEKKIKQAKFNIDDSHWY